MRVLVTGGAGFIGSHIVDEFIAAGHEPAVLDDFSSGSRDNIPESVPVFEADIRDQPRIDHIFDEFQPEWVSHQAAQMSVSRSVREPAFDAEVNVLGLINVLEASRRVGVKRFSFASSGGALYGDVTQPAPEHHAAAPISPYGITKWVGERYLEFYAREHGMPCIALRYANVYGPRQNPHGEAGVVAVFSTRMLSGQPYRINGDGKYIRDYVYVQDVSRANLLSMTQTLDELFAAFNIGTGCGTDVNELAASIRTAATAALEHFGSSRSIDDPEYGPARAGDLRSSLLDAQRAGQALGWKPQVDLTTGLSRTVDWFAEQLLSSRAE